jgi:outer membrane protein assembly factor BamD (BamD/ComL family)
MAAPEKVPVAVSPSSPPGDLPRASAPSTVITPAAPSATGVVTSSLDDEIALVRDARAALRGGDAARSLALLDEHDRRFPGGALAEDCAASRVYALCALGDIARARSAAARFLANHPYSPHAASVRASCGAPGQTN